jgi:hypothetical protein
LVEIEHSIPQLIALWLDPQKPCPDQDTSVNPGKHVGQHGRIHIASSLVQTSAVNDRTGRVLIAGPVCRFRTVLGDLSSEIHPEEKNRENRNGLFESLRPSPSKLMPRPTHQHKRNTKAEQLEDDVIGSVTVPDETGAQLPEENRKDNENRNDEEEYSGEPKCVSFI